MDDTYKTLLKDLNRDGLKDLAIIYPQINKLSIFLDNGNGIFTPHAHYLTDDQPVSLDSGDLNQDGYLDLVVLNKGAGNISIFYGKGDGNFTPQVNYDTEEDPGLVKVFDVNKDNISDIIVSDIFGINDRVFKGIGNGYFDYPETPVVIGVPGIWPWKFMNKKVLFIGYTLDWSGSNQIPFLNFIRTYFDPDVTVTDPSQINGSFGISDALGNDSDKEEENFWHFIYRMLECVTSSDPRYAPIGSWIPTPAFEDEQRLFSPSGQLVLSEMDWVVKSRGFDFTVSRTYNSGAWKPYSYCGPQ